MPARLTRPGAALMGLALACSAMSAAAEPARYRLDPVHTRVLFAVSHAGYSTALGTVSGSTGTLVFDPDDWSSARVEVSVPIARLDLGDDRWNAAALGPSLLDGEHYPVATFVSSRVEPVDATHAIVHGTLTVHGVARDAQLDVSLNQVKRYPLPPFRRKAGFSATTTIDRRDFGVRGWAASVIGDRVELRIEAEGTLTGAVEDAEGPAKAGDAGTGEESSGQPDTPRSPPHPSSGTRR